MKIVDKTLALVLLKPKYVIKIGDLIFKWYVQTYFCFIFQCLTALASGQRTPTISYISPNITTTR